MSDTAEAMSSRQRRQEPSANDSNEDLATTAAASCTTPNEEDGGSTSSDPISSNDVVLSLREERYKEVMQNLFKILGTLRDSAREESAAVELWTHLKNQGARFYRLESGDKGHYSKRRVEDGEALEKIQRT